MAEAARAGHFAAAALARTALTLKDLVLNEIPPVNLWFYRHDPAGKVESMSPGRAQRLKTWRWCGH
jgi:hypothetical protein